MATPRSAWRERLVDVAMLGSAVFCAGVLLVIARKAILHIITGFVFAGASAYTVPRAPCTTHCEAAIQQPVLPFLRDGRLPAG